MHIKPIKSRYRELLETQNLCEIRGNWDVISFFEMRSKYFFTLKRNNWFVYLYAPILEFGNTITMQFLFICFIIWLLKLFVTILTYASAFIMYWHTCMKPKVRQGFFFLNFELNVTLIHVFTTCLQLHTVLKVFSQKTCSSN